MARFRHLHASLPGSMGWEPMEDSGKPCFWCNHGHGGGEHYKAQLENGDHLSLHSIHDPRDGTQNWLGVVSAHPYDKRPADDVVTYHNHDMDSAITSFEQDYRGMDRKSMGSSAIDYDQIINPQAELDDDFGDIFGSDR